MFKYLKLLIICLVFSAQLCAETVPTPKMLTSAFQELIDGTLSPSDDVRVKVDVLDYDIIEQQIAKWGCAFDVKCSFAKAHGVIYVRKPSLAIFGSEASDLDKDVALFLRINLSINEAGLLKNQPLLFYSLTSKYRTSSKGLMSEITWNECKKDLQNYLKRMFPDTHFVLKAIKEKDKEYIDGISIVVDHTSELTIQCKSLHQEQILHDLKKMFPDTHFALKASKEKDKDDIDGIRVVVDHTSEMTFDNKNANQLEILFTIKDPAHAASISPAEEQAVIQTLAALGRQDPAAMQDTQVFLRFMRQSLLQALPLLTQ